MRRESNEESSRTKNKKVRFKPNSKVRTKQEREQCQCGCGSIVHKSTSTVHHSTHESGHALTTQRRHKHIATRSQTGTTLDRRNEPANHESCGLYHVHVFISTVRWLHRQLHLHSWGHQWPGSFHAAEIAAIRGSHLCPRPW